jgi:hypothetical protein
MRPDTSKVHAFVVFFTDLTQQNYQDFFSESIYTVRQKKTMLKQTKTRSCKEMNKI